jgi:hypothetical protein
VLFLKQLAKYEWAAVTGRELMRLSFVQTGPEVAGDAGEEE